MQHTCGYITLLNPNLTSRNGADVEDNAGMFQFAADASREEMIGSDFDRVTETDDDTTNYDRVKNFEDWCLLDMHFGLPLFDAKLNQEICAKVGIHAVIAFTRLFARSRGYFRVNAALCVQMLSVPNFSRSFTFQTSRLSSETTGFNW